MGPGLPGHQGRLCAVVAMGVLLSNSAIATGFYNLGAHWKGAINPYYLGAEGVFQSGFTSGLSASVAGNGDGSVSNPSAMTMDPSGNLYVADRGNSRINKYSSTGVFQGWIGNIATSPTGGAIGCNGASAGTFTPGWCTGGTSSSGNGDGMMNGPASVAADASGGLYVSDTNNHRINKYDAAGNFQGWIGKIATSPTGGAAGCSGAAVGNATPSWCTGGASTFGSQDGMFYSPKGIATDSAGNIYVSDLTTHWVQKFNSSGIVQGWIGAIGGSPTGGATGCNGAASTAFASGWCKGGFASSTATLAQDGFSSPAGLTFDPVGILYVVDNVLNRVARILLQGR